MRVFKWGRVSVCGFRTLFAQWRNWRGDYLLFSWSISLASIVFFIQRDVCKLQSLILHSQPVLLLRLDQALIIIQAIISCYLSEHLIMIWLMRIVHQALFALILGQANVLLVHGLHPRGSLWASPRKILVLVSVPTLIAFWRSFLYLIFMVEAYYCIIFELEGWDCGDPMIDLRRIEDDHRGGLTF